ncbi:MAG: hypothetical protein DCC49_01165 [Acidobacteria bacterium]|nr:MAG: hypothetical protein DCC49_01165 [Acidobacteriota bacterium]
MTANRLHPEGAPGDSERWMRTLLGDSRYEQAIEREQEDREWVRKSRELVIERQTVMIVIFQLLAGILLVLFLLGIVMVPTVIAWLWNL